MFKVNSIKSNDRKYTEQQLREIASNKSFAMGVVGILGTSVVLGLIGSLCLPINGITIPLMILLEIVNCLFWIDKATDLEIKLFKDYRKQYGLISDLEDEKY